MLPSSFSIHTLSPPPTKGNVNILCNNFYLSFSLIFHSIIKLIKYPFPGLIPPGNLFPIADRFQFDPRSTFFFRDVPPEYLNPSAAEASKQSRKDLTAEFANHHRSQSQETTNSSSGPQGTPGNRSAFRAVHQGEPSPVGTFITSTILSWVITSIEPIYSFGVTLMKTPKEIAKWNCYTLRFHPQRKSTYTLYWTIPNGSTAQ